LEGELEKAVLKLELVLAFEVIELVDSLLDEDLLDEVLLESVDDVNLVELDFVGIGIDFAELILKEELGGGDEESHPTLKYGPDPL